MSKGNPSPFLKWYKGKEYLDFNSARCGWTAGCYHSDCRVKELTTMLKRLVNCKKAKGTPQYEELKVNIWEDAEKLLGLKRNDSEPQ